MAPFEKWLWNMHNNYKDVCLWIHNPHDQLHTHFGTACLWLTWGILILKMFSKVPKHMFMHYSYCMVLDGKHTNYKKKHVTLCMAIQWNITETRKREDCVISQARPKKGGKKHPPKNLWQFSHAKTRRQYWHKKTHSTLRQQSPS